MSWFTQAGREAGRAVDSRYECHEQRFERKRERGRKREGDIVHARNPITAIPNTHHPPPSARKV